MELAVPYTYWRWWYLPLILLTLLGMLVGTVYASGLGGYISEKVIGRTGVTNSSLVIGSSLTPNSDLDVTMGPIVSVLPATGVIVSGAGSQATLHGSVVNLNGFPSATVWFEWGYDSSYGNTTTHQAIVATGEYTADIAHFDATRVVYYRFVSQTDGIAHSSNGTFIVSGPNAGIPTLPLYPLTLAIVVILSMIATIKLGYEPLTIIVMLAMEIYIGVAWAASIQAMINSLW